jgi:hypothetical protein
MTQAFNLSQFANKVNTSGQASLTTAVTGTLPVANGGTNQTSYTDGQLLIGNTTGNTLTKSTLTAGSGITITNGSGSISIASASGQLQSQLFTGPGTWTCPASTSQVRVTVVGGGAGSSGPGVTGAGGGTSSFGPAVSCTGGITGPAGAPAPATLGITPGTGTVAVGTAIKAGTGIGSVYWNIGSSPSSPSITTLISPALGILGGVGKANAPSASAVAYSASGIYAAGGGGGGNTTAIFNGSSGGLAVAIVPVSAPVSITVGAGGASSINGSGGVGGAVLVEWVS